MPHILLLLNDGLEEVVQSLDHLALHVISHIVTLGYSPSLVQSGTRRQTQGEEVARNQKGKSLGTKQRLKIFHPVTHKINTMTEE
jgi:hypothetical protein